MLRRSLWVLGALVAAWVAFCLIFFVWPPAETGAPAHAGVVVMLSGDRERLQTALALVRRGVAPVLALSSVRRTPTWVAARRLCAAGSYHRARVVCFLASPYSTRGEAEVVARLARARGWRSVVIVTSTFHVTRAHMLFRRCYHGTMSFVGAPSAWWRLPLEWADETAKLAYQLMVQRAC